MQPGNGTSSWSINSVSILSESYCNPTVAKRVCPNISVSILSESYCNPAQLLSVWCSASISILSESYCNCYHHILRKLLFLDFNSLRVLLQHASRKRQLSCRNLISILSESYCNLGIIAVGILFGLFQFSQSLIATSSSGLLSSPSPIFQFSQSLIATYSPIHYYNPIRYISILSESYCNFTFGSEIETIYSNFNSLRVLLQRGPIWNGFGWPCQFQFSQSLIATETSEPVVVQARVFQFSQSLIATPWKIPGVPLPPPISILSESYCNLKPDP